MNVAFQKRRTRIGMLTLLLVALFLVAIARLVILVAFDGPRLNSMAASEHSGEVELAAVRGPIIDRNGEPLALSAETTSIYARPRELFASSTAADRARLATALGISPVELERHLRHPAPFVWLARHLPNARARQVEALGLEGIGQLTEYKRFYPESNLAASVVGMAGLDGQGLSGVELGYNRLIRGQPLKLRVYHDALGHPILDSPLALRNAEPGDRVELTIDAGIQSLAESRLRAQVASSGARAGTAIVLDPWSGEVLALANVKAGRAGLHNRLHDTAIQDAFEPGSTMKGLLGSIALQDGTIDTSRRIWCEDGRYHFGRFTIHDDSPHGWLALPDIIEVSSNIGAAKIALALGADRYYRGLRAFGIGRRTGIDLPGEAAGLLRPESSWREIDLANHGFGQGIAVTPMQLAVAYAAIANGGLVMRPYVVKAVYNPTGTPVLVHTPQVMRRAITPAIAHQVNLMLRNVVNGADGTARRAKVEGFIVAGKTGTAQMVNPATGGYFQSRLVASFVGFLPADDPRLVILVVLYDVGHGHFGGLVAAPVFSAIATGAVRQLDITAPRPPGYESASILPLDVLNRAESLVSNDSAAAEIADASVPAGAASSSLPDFAGLSLRQALALAHQRDLNLEVKGSGWVIAQKPPAGVPAGPDTVKLTLAADPRTAGAGPDARSKRDARHLRRRGGESRRRTL
ncbi:MAG TPA: penicillin-binding protein [Candidatus Binataceae bacterium]|nr:penicillin-binding protein [Candidatus Binataceae bacterium]